MFATPTSGVSEMSVGIFKWFLTIPALLPKRIAVI
jgi:hypothetical protein